MKKVLFPPADSARQAQNYAKFRHYSLHQPDSIDIFIKNNRTLVYRFYSKLIRQAAFAKLEGEQQAAREYYRLAAQVALKSRIYFNDLYYLYVYQFYLGLSNQQLAKKILSDYYNYLGYLEKNANRYDSAKKFYSKAIKLSRGLDDLVGESYAQFSLYQILIDPGQKSERQAALARAHELIDKSYHKLYKIYILNLEGEENSNIGFYDRAAELFQQACSLSKEIGSDCELARNQERLGICYMRLGHFRQAADTWRQAEKIAQDNSNTLLLINLKALQGNLQLEMSHFQEAITCFKQAGILYLSVNDSLNFAVTRVNSGIPYFKLGQYDSALACLNEGLVIQERLQDYENAVLTLTTISNVYHKLSNFEAAEQYFRRAEKYLPLVKAMLSKATFYRIIGESYLLMNKPDSAYARYQIAKNISEEMGDSLYLAFAYEGLGLAALKKQNLKLARHHFGQVQLIAWQKKHDRLLFMANYDFARLHMAQQENQLALEFFEKAIQYVESIRASVDTMDYKMSFLAHHLQIYDDLICFAIERLQAPERAFIYAEKAHARNLFELLQRKQLNPPASSGSQLLKEFASKPEAFGHFTSSIANPASGYRNIQRHLPPKACLIEYYLTKTYAFVWLIDSLNVTTQVLKIPYDSLGQAVDAFRKDIGADLFQNFQERVRQNPKATFASNVNLSNQLYTLLIKPFENRLKDYKTLVIIPHDFLTYLPFAALTDNGTIQQPNFLVERFSLITAPSSTIFALCYHKSQQSPPVSPKTRLLSVSVPISDIQYLRKLSDDLKYFFEQPTIVVDQIEESAVDVQMQADISIIHFGTHCIIYEDNPMYSHLVLNEHQSWKNSDRSQTTNQTHDGLLTAREILYQDLSHISLVTLASCETALGKYYGGEGLVGLTFAFLGSGAQNIISALWKVDDRFTFEIMHSFYGHIIQPQISSAKSLQLANLQVIGLLQKDPQIKYPFPYYWAAFVCCGYCR